MMSIDEQIPDAELPELPGDLCGIWSFIKWELAGCPNRSQQESAHEYQQAIEARSGARKSHSCRVQHRACCQPSVSSCVGLPCLPSNTFSAALTRNTTRREKAMGTCCRSFGSCSAMGTA